MENKKPANSYEEMTKGKVYEDSEVPTDRVPFQNEFEKSMSNSNGRDQSGMSKGK